MSDDPNTHHFPYVVILDNIRSALNVGAIFRTCDGAGATKLYLCGITPYPPHNRIPKTALGAEEYVEWERCNSTTDLVKKLINEGYTIFCIEQTPKSLSYSEAKFPPKSAIIFGHEITGVDQEILDMADYHIQIPMFGQKNSLNVATTAGIICYHLALQFAHD